MTVARSLAAAAMFAGLAVGTANTAWAQSPTMDGPYMKSWEGGGAWLLFTPCGPGCAMVTNWRQPDSASMPWQARVVNGQWVMDNPDIQSVDCEEGGSGSVPAKLQSVWDPNTGVGQDTRTVTFSDCGWAAGDTVKIPFTITKMPT